MLKLLNAWSLATTSDVAQLEPGVLAFEGRRQRVRDVDASYTRFTVGAMVSGPLEKPALALVLPASSRTKGQWFGCRFGYGDVLVGARGVDLRTCGPSEFLAATISTGPGPALDHAVVHSKQLSRRIRAALWTAIVGDVNDEAAEANRLISNFLTGELRASLTSLFAPQARKTVGSRALSRRVAAVHRCEAYLREHAEGNPTLQELSRISGFRPRSLFNAFEAVTGMSPMSYLRRLRLNNVRRDLQHSAFRKRIVDVAADWGFWHMGHFTADYRALFGELPSETLRGVKTRLIAN